MPAPLLVSVSSPVCLEPVMRLVLALIACLIPGSTPQGILYLEEYSECEPLGGLERVCRKLRDCSPALLGIRRRRFPEICTFLGLEPVVCCPVSRHPTTRQQGVGEVCRGGAQPWYCRKHNDCPGLKEAIDKGLNPSICSFASGRPVVCCPPSGADLGLTTTTTTTEAPSSRPGWPSWTRPEGGTQTKPSSTSSWQTRPSSTNSWQTRPSSTNSWQRPSSTNSWQRPSSSNSWQTLPSSNSWQTRPPTTSETKTPESGWPSWTRPPSTSSSSTGSQTGDRGDSQTSTDTPPVPKLSKSEQKCLEYAEYVYQIRKSPIPGGPDTKEAFCGRVVTPLIVKGEDAKPREFPHMVQIGYGEQRRINWLCGGSLISERFVLSAAHCTSPKGFGPAKWARLGDLDTATERDEALPATMKIVERTDNPGYNGKFLYHDIALYKLERDAALGIFVRPACLNPDLGLVVREATASGWGHTIWKDPTGGKSLLQKVTIKMVPNGVCNNSYTQHFDNELPMGIHSDYMICAGGHDGKDTCQGDSGGPLQIARREPYCTYSIIGVTSFGKGCGSATPGVYTNVAYYIPWIESIVWPT